MGFPIRYIPQCASVTLVQNKSVSQIRYPNAHYQHTFYTKCMTTPLSAANTGHSLMFLHSLHTTTLHPEYLTCIHTYICVQKQSLYDIFFIQHRRYIHFISFIDDICTTNLNHFKQIGAVFHYYAYINFVSHSHRIKRYRDAMLFCYKFTMCMCFQINTSFIYHFMKCAPC